MEFQVITWPAKKFPSIKWHVVGGISQAGALYLMLWSMDHVLWLFALLVLVYWAGVFEVGQHFEKNNRNTVKGEVFRVLLGAAYGCFWQGILVANFGQALEDYTLD